MPLVLTQILLPLTVASLGLLALLTGALVLERVARNRREQLARVRRASYAEVLARGDGGELQRLAVSAAGSVSARGDLVDALALTGWTTGPLFAEHEALTRAAEADVGHGDVGRRAIGTSLLGVIGGARSVELLQRLMREDRDRELRLIAARALRVVGGDEAAWQLILGLRDDVLPKDRILEQLGRPFAAHALLQAMQIADFNEVRADIADALGLAAYAPAAHALGGLVRFGSSESGRRRAAHSVVSAIRSSCRSSPVRWRTTRGSCAPRPRRRSAPARTRPAVAPLAAALADRNWWVRANSAASLRLCGPTGLAALRHAASDHPDRYARDRALEALALEAASARHAVAA